MGFPKQRRRPVPEDIVTPKCARGCPGHTSPKCAAVARCLFEWKALQTQQAQGEAFSEPPHLPGPSERTPAPSVSSPGLRKRR